MRIGFDVSQTSGERAGCGWFADSLAGSLAEKCAQSGDKLMYYHQFDRWTNSDNSTGTLSPELGVESPFFNMSPEEAAALWKNIALGSEKPPGDPDIIHSNNFSAPICKSAKLVYTVYDISFWMYPEFTTEGNRLNCQDGLLAAMKNADAFAFISENSLHEFKSTFPGWLESRKKPSIVMPLGVRKDKTPVCRENKPDYWLTVGSLEPRKNHTAILDAMDSYWEKSVLKLPLMIAGGAGWKSDDLRVRIEKMESEGKVKSLGYVPDEELPKLYQKALGFIYASWHEGFGLPILEAMANACPVISSNRASLPEVGGDAVSYIDPSRYEEIVAAMIALESSEKLANEHSVKGLEQCKKFTWESAADKVLDFYRAILAK
jgi:glycosyltransferase involved in cell wall biosynthesis